MGGFPSPKMLESNCRGGTRQLDSHWSAYTPGWVRQVSALSARPRITSTTTAGRRLRNKLPMQCIGAEMLVIIDNSWEEALVWCLLLGSLPFAFATASDCLSESGMWRTGDFQCSTDGRATAARAACLGSATASISGQAK